MALGWSLWWFVGVAAAVTACPSQCRCRTTLQEVKVNCSGSRWAGPIPDLPDSTTELDIGKSHLSSLMDLSAMPALKTLVMYDNKLRDLANIETMAPSLVHLDISRNNLASFPISLPQDLKTFKVSGNVISDTTGLRTQSLNKLTELYLDSNKITSVVFHSADDKPKCILVQLLKLSLNRNVIKDLPDGMFACLTRLQALALSDNAITSLGPKTFQGLIELTYLDLSHNVISFIQKDTFKRMGSLKYLYLSWNVITMVPYPLPYLDWLDLSHNHIEYVNETLSKGDLYPIEIVNLAHNPLVCDCRLLWLKEVWDRKEYVLHYTEAIKSEEFVPVCAGPPTLAGESWDMLSDTVFRCERDYDETKERPRKTSSSVDEDEPSDVRLSVSLGAVNHDSVTVHWNNLGQDTCTWVFVQFYQFGHRADTTMFAQVDFTLSRYTVQHLQPSTSYVICVIPKVSSEISVTNFDQCIEATTVAMPAVTMDATWLPSFLSEVLGLMSMGLILACFVMSVLIVAAAWLLFEVIVFLVKRKMHED